MSPSTAESRDEVEMRLTAKMLRIRAFEESLDRLFESGAIRGTYHRCIGQEATAVGVCSLLSVGHDFVVSNHRNHGHYLAFSDDYRGLIEELKGSPQGVTGGRGGSQVIFGEQFVSSGILGSTAPFAAGIALSMKRDGQPGCCACFLGDGAMCEGVVYETLNLAALWSLPILFVVEMNGVAQSVDTSQIIAGSLTDRFGAFGIPAVQLNTTDVIEVREGAAASVKKARDGGPAALLVEAPRLCPHSKGDDLRDATVLTGLRKRDPLEISRQRLTNFAELERAAREEISQLVGV